MKYGIMYYKDTDNIGDDFQTYAAKRFLKHIDYYIDRETMDSFLPKEKEYVALIMNGWFMNNKLTWPPSPYIYPHLVSMHFTNAGLFNAGDAYIEGKVAKYLNSFEKIGCRDTETIKRLEKYGVKNCYFTGCLTLTLNKFDDVQKQDYICAVDLNENVVKKIRGSTKKEVKVITQNNYNLVNMSFEERMKETENVLKIFQGASVVITRRLHAMFPSIALETPVILLRQAGYENEKDRFQDFLSLASATYTEAEFLNLDITNIINNPKPNSDRYLEIRSNLIKSCEEFINKCESINLDTSKLPELEQYIKHIEEETKWNAKIGTAVVECEKAKQKEYIENWEKREKYYKDQEEYWKNQQKEYEKNWKDRENYYKSQEEYWKKQQKEYEINWAEREKYITNLESKEMPLLKKENNKLKEELETIYNSKLWKILGTKKKVKTKNNYGD